MWLKNSFYLNNFIILSFFNSFVVELESIIKQLRIDKAFIILKELQLLSTRY